MNSRWKTKPTREKRWIYELINMEWAQALRYLRKRVKEYSTDFWSIHRCVSVRVQQNRKKSLNYTHQRWNGCARRQDWFKLNWMLIYIFIYFFSFKINQVASNKQSNSCATENYYFVYFIICTRFIYGRRDIYWVWVQHGISFQAKSFVSVTIRIRWFNTSAYTLWFHCYRAAFDSFNSRKFIVAIHLQCIHFHCCLFYFSPLRKRFARIFQSIDFDFIFFGFLPDDYCKARYGRRNGERKKEKDIARTFAEAKEFSGRFKHHTTKRLLWECRAQTFVR